MQGRHLLEGLEGWRSTDPQGFMILVFSLWIVFLKQCYCCNNNVSRELDPKDHWDPNNLMKRRPWHDDTADSGINDQLIKMHNAHSWINVF